MWRNILCQSAFQLVLLLVLIFNGDKLFNVPKGVTCERYKVDSGNTDLWDPLTGVKSPTGTISCASFTSLCPSDKTTIFNSYTQAETCFKSNNVETSDGTFTSLSDLEGYEDTCLTCAKNGYKQNTIIFNAFIFCQIFNEYNARRLGDELNVFEGIHTNPIFLMVTAFSVIAQIFLVYVGGDFVKTSWLTPREFFITAALGALSLPVGVLMRFIPVTEDPDSFFHSEILAHYGGGIAKQAYNQVVTSEEAANPA